jgi:hypothetical protein
MILENQELLNQVFQKWYYGDQPLPSWPRKYIKTNYRNQQFEDWLWERGFTVVQKEKQRYLRFSGDAKQLTFFLLKYGTK